MNENHVFTGKKQTKPTATRFMPCSRSFGIGSRDRSVKAFNVRMEGDHPVEQFVIPGKAPSKNRIAHVATGISLLDPFRAARVYCTTSTLDGICKPSSFHLSHLNV